MNAKQNLLIVDENPYVAGILVQTLRAEFNVTVAKTGLEATHLLMQGHRFDCVLTELNLPKISGLELTKFIRSNRSISHTPVVMLSSATDSNTRIRCLDQGVDGYMTKPFNPLEVKARLRAVLRRFSMPIEHAESRLLSTRSTPANKPARQIKSRILSIFQRDFAMPQSA